MKLKAPCHIWILAMASDLDQWQNALEAYIGHELDPLIAEPYSNRAKTYKTWDDSERR